MERKLVCANSFLSINSPADCLAVNFLGVVAKGQVENLDCISMYESLDQPFAS